jgi:enoyl-CoA hydratase/carnithine racemase
MWRSLASSPRRRTTPTRGSCTGAAREKSFCAGNDIEDFLKNPPGPDESPQAMFMKALVNLDKPMVAAVHGAAIGGATMLTHCDFIYAAKNAKFQMPFINLALVPEFGSSCSVPGADRPCPYGGAHFVGSSL